MGCEGTLGDAAPRGLIGGLSTRRYNGQKRSLPGLFGAIGSFRIVGLHQNGFDLRCLQRRWALVFQYGWNLVQAVFTKDLLFHQSLAQSHVDTAFGLTLDEQGIEGAAAIVPDPHSVDLDLASLAV